MTGREWKPGMVAAVQMRRKSDPADVDNYKVCLYDGINREWVSNTSGRLYPGDLWEIDARPLVVIDPENREQVERLIRGFWAGGNDDCDDVRAMADALREFADPKPPKPPKPAEPTGLGAVVEDADGVRWTRVEAGEAETRNPWYPADCEEQPNEWLEIDAVKVLSEGVTL